jgi:hypothetical protein
VKLSTTQHVEYIMIHVGFSGASLAPFSKIIPQKYQGLRPENGAPRPHFSKNGIQMGYKLGYKSA